MKLTRLSVNMNQDTHDALMEISGKRHISMTEVIRRAVLVLKYVEDVHARGDKLLIEEQDGRITELILL